MKYLLIIFLTLFIHKYTFANSLFDTEFYEIKFTSDNVENDKLLKISEIKNKSYITILKNILSINEFTKIRTDINEDLINTFIKNIIFQDEKIINNNYYSKIKINYDKNKIVKYLRNKKISYVEYLPVDYLTIILENNNSSKYLLSKKNSYYSFLINNNNTEFNFFNIPNLDINDRYMLNFSDIDKKTISKIRNFTDKYSKKESILIISNLKNNKYKYTIYLYSNNQLINISEFNESKLNFNNIFSKIKFEVLNEWKEINKIDNKIINIIKCETKYFNLLELKKIKENLLNTSNIKSINLISISYKSNLYNINYFGEKKLLPELFIKNGLNIKIIDNECKIYLK